MTTKTKFTGYITKYALTSGIKREEMKTCLAMSPDMVKVNLDGFDYYFHGEGSQWHRTKESAIARAEQMRFSKIAALKKRIAKLEKLTFNL